MLGLLPQPRIQFFDANGNPLNGGFVYTCLPGGSITDLKASYQDAGGTVLNANPVQLDSAGRATIFLDGYYHIFLQDSLHVDIYNVDNVSASSFFSSITAEWVRYGATPTYINGTQFSVPGNHVSDFPKGLRLKASVTAGTIYGTVVNAVAGGGPVVTTVTVIWDSGSLDAGLSAIYYGILSPVNPSLPVFPVQALNGSHVFVASEMDHYIT